MEKRTEQEKYRALRGRFLSGTPQECEDELRIVFRDAIGDEKYLSWVTDAICLRFALLLAKGRAKEFAHLCMRAHRATLSSGLGAWVAKREDATRGLTLSWVG